MLATLLLSAALSSPQARVLNEGRWANAVLSLVENLGEHWVVKDFAPRPWLVRATVGRLFVAREYEALRRLQGIDGCGAYGFMYRCQ